MSKKNIIAILGFLIGIVFTSLVIWVYTISIGDSSSETYKRNSKSFEEDYNWVNLPDFDEDEQPYEFKTLNSESPITFDLREYRENEIVINGVNVSGQEMHELSIGSISKDNTITIEIDGQVNEIQTLPTFLSEYDYTNSGTDDGYYYFTYGDYLVKLSTEGEIVYYNNVGRAYDFKANETEDGEIFYSYLQHVHPQEKFPDIGYHPTKAVIMDENYRVVDEVESIIETKKVEKAPLENHDFLFIDKNHYILSSYYPERVSNIPNDVEQNPYGTRVISPYLQEIKNDEVIWEWKGTEHTELYKLSVEHNDYTNEHTLFSDYAHFNAMDIDYEDGNILLSMRNLDAILKVNRETGDIMWVLGGKGDEFGLEENQKFRRQHKITKLDDGSLLLFNNGNYLPAAPYPIIEEDDPLRDETPVTTIMKFKIDEKDKSLIEFNNLETEHFSGTRGSAQETESGSVLIGWGSGENNKEHFREVDFDTGEELFVFYPHDEDLISYRAYKFSY